MEVWTALARPFKGRLLVGGSLQNLVRRRQRHGGCGDEMTRFHTVIAGWIVEMSASQGPSNWVFAGTEGL